MDEMKNALDGMVWCTAVIAICTFIFGLLIGIRI